MKRLSKLGFLPLLLPLVLLAMMLLPILSFAAQPAKVELGSTVTFAVLAGSAITNTGSTTITGGLPEGGGNIGIHPGSAIIGLADITMTGWTAHIADAVAGIAKDDLQLAYDDAAGRTSDEDLTGQDLGNLTLTSGVYAFDTSAQLTGTLTLDAEGDPNAVFIFQIGSTLTTASQSTVNLINGARFCRVFWQLGSSATLGTYSHFAGHIFAQTSITATTGAEIQGQLLALTGAVTLDTNIITNALCDDIEPTTDETTTIEATTGETTTIEATTGETTTVEATTGETTTVESTTGETTTVEATTGETTTVEATTGETTTMEITTTEATTIEATTVEATTTETTTIEVTTIESTMAETTVIETTTAETTTQPAIETTVGETTSATAVSTTTAADTQKDTPIPSTGNDIVKLVVLMITTSLIFSGVAYAARRKTDLI